MPKYDFSDVDGELRSSGYQAGPVTLKIGKWSFEESKTGKPYLLLTWDKEGFARDDGKPFTSSRLYFSSPKAVQIARGKIHDLCDIVGATYDKDAMSDNDAIINFSHKLEGQEVSAELVPTGEVSDKGFAFLGVRVHDRSSKHYTDFFIPAKNTDAQPQDRVQEVSEAMGLDDDGSDIPF